ncbi:MAG: nuclear transport factor 2 family protein [Candidatus Parcubacteria bacterium]|nr:nuclear transport factor 2 family protein [Burkholderiales bacterium]
MDTEGNKQLAKDFFQLLGKGDIPGALACTSDDLTYWIAGKPGSVPTCGTKDKKQMARLFEAMLKALEGGLPMTVKGVTAENDRVALELESRGKLKSGRVYNNEYHILLRFRDGKICAVREYLDTQHVNDIWFRPAA